MYHEFTCSILNLPWMYQDYQESFECTMNLAGVFWMYPECTWRLTNVLWKYQEQLEHFECTLNLPWGSQMYLESLQCTLNVPGAFWRYPECTWWLLNVPEGTQMYLESFEFTWSILNVPGNQNFLHFSEWKCASHKCAWQMYYVPGGFIVWMYIEYIHFSS